MQTLAISLLLLLVLAESNPTPKFPLSKETTYVSGPLDEEGYIDYEAALNNRLGKGITPERNANVLLWKAIGPHPDGIKGMPTAYFKRLGIDEPPEEGTYFLALRAYLRDQLKNDEEARSALEKQHERAAKRPWTVKDYPQIADWLHVNEKPLALVLEATKRPDYFNPLVAQRAKKSRDSLLGALLPNVQKCRELANALATRAMLRIGEGKIDEAWQDLFACHRLARLVARGATLIEALVGIAIEQTTSDADLAYLEHAKRTPQQIQERLKDLQALPPMLPLADKLDLTDRMISLETYQMLRRYGVTYLEGLSGGSLKEPDSDELKALGKIDWEPGLRSTNLWFDRITSALRHKDRAERVKELDKIDLDLKALKEEATKPKNLAKLRLGMTAPDKTVGKAISDVLIGLLMPAFNKVQVAYDRAEQVQRNLHLAFALAAYRREHGRYPAKLDELAPKYLATIPDDLFSGEALLYRPEASGYLLYSVGPNGKDQGGRRYDDRPPGDDLRVRMPVSELVASGAVRAVDKQQLLNRYGLTPTSILLILRQKAAQEDLKLSKENAKKPQELYEKYLEVVRESRNLGREERQAKVGEQMKVNQEALAEMLNAKQAERLVQISLQVRGGNTLANAQVAKELKLTDEQKERIKTIRAGVLPALLEVSRARREAQPGPHDEATRKKYDEETRKIMAKERKATSEKLLNLLTPEQKAKWKEMIGEPLKGEFLPSGTPTSPNRAETDGP